jgi:hypothetical protein
MIAQLVVISGDHSGQRVAVEAILGSHIVDTSLGEARISVWPAQGTPAEGWDGYSRIQQPLAEIRGHILEEDMFIPPDRFPEDEVIQLCDSTLAKTFE